MYQSIQHISNMDFFCYSKAQKTVTAKAKATVIETQNGEFRSKFPAKYSIEFICDKTIKKKLQIDHNTISVNNSNSNTNWSKRSINTSFVNGNSIPTQEEKGERWMKEGKKVLCSIESRYHSHSHFDEQRKLVYSVETLHSVAFSSIERKHSSTITMEPFAPPPHRKHCEGETKKRNINMDKQDWTTAGAGE